MAGESSEVLAGERETITALFADIKGSMELIEGLGPEEALARQQSRGKGMRLKPAA